MNVHDSRMDIMALCTVETLSSVASLTSDPFLPPLSTIRAGECNTEETAVAATTVSRGQSPTKKRSRRLSNSERGKLYRSRRKNFVQTLEEQVEQLKKEVNQLNLVQRQKFSTWSLLRQPIGPSFVSVVREYFSVFKYGVLIAKQSGVMDISHDQVLLSDEQTRFLNRLMHPKVVFGNSYGLQELMNQWGKYSLYHAGLKFEVQSLQIMAVDPNPVVHAPATLYVRFTRRTIEKIFPHLLWNEMFVQRLIGREFAYPVKAAFFFGNDNKIHRIDTYVDFVAAFMSVLGNVEECKTMMESALIRQDAMIGDLLEEPDSDKVNQTDGAEQTHRVEVVDISGMCRSVSGECKSLAPKGTRIGMSLHSIL